MTLEEAYAEKGRLVTELEFHEEKLKRVNQIILQYIRDHALGNGDKNVMESEEVASNTMKGKKITLRYPKDESPRPVA